MAKSPVEKSKTLTRSITQPTDTLQYIVTQSDTLESIAARCDSTPSEIKKINRLSTRTLFPGQLLYVPITKEMEAEETKSPNGDLATSGPSQTQDDRRFSLEQEKNEEEKFLKINTRYITDGKGVVSGIMLVTPNCLMFEPNVSDPLIIEKGTKKFQVNIPLDFIIKAGMYQDIAHMRIKDNLDESLQHSPKPKVYIPPKTEESPPSLETTMSSVSLDSGDPNPTLEDKQPADNSELRKNSLVACMKELGGQFADVKPEAFSNFENLIPRPSRTYEGAPYYLCLRMGRLTDPFLISQISPNMDQFTKTKREYWFSVPHKMKDTLYNFLNKWAPDMYGEVEEYSPGFRSLRPLEEDSDDSDSEAYSLATVRKFSLQEGKKPQIVALKKEMEMPELLDESEILTEENIGQLYQHFPPRTIGNQMQLFYTTSKHGFSLRTLYRRLAVDYDGPVLLVIQDSNLVTFGALCSSPFRCSGSFYGTGESFLYSFFPLFQAYKWSGENSYFIKGDLTSLAIGAGNGFFGIWLDGDLYRGRSRPCSTYNNPILSANEDFVVKTIEAWGFV